MENQVAAIVPSKEKHIHILTEGRTKEFKTPAKALEWLVKQEQGNGSKPQVLAIMGGAGQEFFSRLVDMGMAVNRLPIYQLQENLGVQPKASPDERASALMLMWQESKESFYPMEPLDQTVVLIRELTRQRLNIQEFRKSATLQIHGALRSLGYILPAEANQLMEFLRAGLKEMFRDPKNRGQIEAEFRRLETEVQLTDQQQAHLLAIRKFFSDPAFVLGAKKDEQELEKQISKLLPAIPIWRWINPEDSGLPAIKGFGPAIGGSVLSEIGDIRRFPTPEALRAYARFHVATDGKFPHRKIGEVSPFNRYLSRAVWLWSSDQVARYDSCWKSLYLWKKAREMQAHPETVARQVIDKRSRTRTVYDFTLKHLDSRAKRWTGSQLLNYLWTLWQEVAKGNNPEKWYPVSSWPEYFAKARQELDTGLAAYLEAEIPKRRRVEPKEEEEEENE